MTRKIAHACYASRMLVAAPRNRVAILRGAPYGSLSEKIEAQQ